MPVFKHTLEFIEGNGATFSEIYYANDSSLTAAKTYPDAFYSARLTMLMAGHTLLRDRVSQVGASRVTGRRVINLVGQIPVTGAGKFNPGPPGGAMVVNLVGLNGGSRYLWMRGGTSVDLSYNQFDQPSPSAGWLINIAGWLSSLSLSGWGLIQLANVGANPPQTVSLVDGMTTPGKSVLTMAAPLAGAVAGGRVVLGKFNKKDLPSLNGQFSIIAVAGTALTINYATPQNAKITTTQGQVRVATYGNVSVVDPANSKFAYAGSRITKNPYSRSRGARRAARLRNLA